jgi:hypothetical protein
MLAIWLPFLVVSGRCFKQPFHLLINQPKAAKNLARLPLSLFKQPATEYYLLPYFQK